MDRRAYLRALVPTIGLVSGCLQGDYVAIEVTNHTGAQQSGHLIVGGGYCDESEATPATDRNTTDLGGICLTKEFQLGEGETVREPRVMRISDYGKSLVIVVDVDGYNPIQHRFHVGPGSPVTFEVRIETEEIEIHRF